MIKFISFEWENLMKCIKSLEFSNRKFQSTIFYFFFSLFLTFFLSSSPIHTTWLYNINLPYRENLFCKKIKQVRCDIWSLIPWHTNASFSQRLRWRIFYTKVLSLPKIYHGSFPMISKSNHMRYCVNFFDRCECLREIHHV